MDSGYLNKVMDAHTKYDSMVKEMSSEIAQLQDQLSQSFEGAESDEAEEEEEELEAYCDKGHMMRHTTESMYGDRGTHCD